MDSKSEMYECFAEMMIDSFHNFLSKLEKSDGHNFVCSVMDKLQDIHRILQKVFEKRNSSMMNVQRAKDISSVLPTIEIEKGQISNYGVEKRKSSVDLDVNHNSDYSDVLQRAEKWIRRDIESSDDSDCEEWITASVNSPIDLCFQTVTKKEDVNFPGVSSGKSLTDDLYIRKIIIKKSNVKNNGDVDTYPYGPYVVKVAPDVYHCQICLIGQMPKNNVAFHVTGRRHRSALQEKKKCELKPMLEKTDSWIGTSRIEDEPSITGMFECTLCETTMSCEENAIDHINGKKHKHKLELLG